MSSSVTWPRPPRLVGRAEPSDLVQWHLRLAIAATKTGSATELARRLGVTPNIIHLAVHRGRCTYDLARRIETLYGPEYFPSELFAPEPELPVE